MRPSLLAACLFAPLSAAAAVLPDGPARRFTAQIMEARSRAKNIWPGFDLIRDPLLINFPGTGTVLMHDTVGYEGFTNVGSGVSFKPGRFDLTSARFDGNVPLGGRSSFFFRYEATETDRDEVELLIHEAFHKYQRATWPGVERHSDGRRELSALSSADAGRIAYAVHIENAALFQAMASPDRFLNEARTFVALRRKRLASMDRPLADMLLDLETQEGCAEYVALRSALKTPFDAGAVATFLAPSLAGALFVFAEPDVDAARRLDRSVYGSGPAQMLILDRLRTPWKDRVARGETIFSVMLDAISTDDEGGRTRRALARWGDAGLERALKLSRLAAGGEPDEMRANFALSRLPRVLLRIWDAKASPGLAFSGSQPLRGADNSLLYANIGEASLSATNGVSATFRRTTVRSGSGKEQKRVGRMEQFPVEVEALLPEPAFRNLRVDGEPFSPSEAKQAFRKLEWSGLHIELMISRPGSIAKTDGRIIVEVDPPRDR